MENADITYDLPYGPVGAMPGGWLVRGCCVDAREGKAREEKLGDVKLTDGNQVRFGSSTFEGSGTIVSYSRRDIRYGSYFIHVHT